MQRHQEDNNKQVSIRNLFIKQKPKDTFYQRIHNLKLFDPEYFLKYYRLTTLQFEKIGRLLDFYPNKDSTSRKPNDPIERSSVTLRYLVTGGSQVVLVMLYQIWPTTINGLVVEETCPVILKVFPKHGYLKAAISPSYTARNVVISPNFLVWKFCRKAQFGHNFEQITRNNAEIVPFRNTSTRGS